MDMYYRNDRNGFWTFSRKHNRK